MNPKSTWVWTFLAAGLLAFIFFYRQYLHRQNVGPQKVLPGFKADAVTAVLLLPRGKREIRAERTQGVWQLTAPLVYPAQANAIEKLLATFEQLGFAAYIPERELRTHAQPNEEFGIEPAQMSLFIQQGTYRNQIHIGHRTPPGDQVYVQIVGVPGIFITDAGWLELLPTTGGDWRSTALADWSRLAFDRLIVTNFGKAQPLELHRDPTNQLWLMVSPMAARADTAKVEAALQSLQHLSVRQFIEDARVDLELLGLQPPDLSVILAQGTNPVLALDFGKTNSAGLVYTRYHDRNALVTVANSLVEPWRASHEAFRSRQLVTLTHAVDHIEIQARDTFQLHRQTSNSWSVVPQGFAADTALVHDLLSTLSGREVDFVKDSVTDLDLPQYGLAPATAWRYVLKSNNGGTNTFSVELNFGTNHEGQVFARRVDESSVSTLKPADFAQLPSASWQLRDRRIWNFPESDIARITVREGGKTREFVHGGTNQWTHPAGSQGMINIFATEELAHQLGRLTAAYWAGHGEENRAGFGFTPDGLQLAIELRNGEQRKVEFGGTAASGFPLAAVTLDRETWIFEFPWGVYQLVQTYLAIPAKP